MWLVLMHEQFEQRRRQRVAFFQDIFLWYPPLKISLRTLIELVVLFQSVEELVKKSPDAPILRHEEACLSSKESPFT